MSISTIRHFLEKSGCALVVSIVLALMFVIGFLWNSNSSSSGGGGEGQELVIATVAGTPITFNQVEEDAREQTQQYYMQMESVPVEMEADLLGRVLRQLVTQSLVIELAKQGGIALTDEDVLSTVKSEFEQSVQSEKALLVSEGKLKAGATDVEVDGAFKVKHGSTLTEMRAHNLEDAKNVLADPKRRPNLVAFFTNQALVNARKGKMVPSDDVLKKSFDTLVVKRIMFNGTKGNAMESAAKAIGEVKGGLTFEQAIDRYSTEAPEKGKKLSETTTNMTAASLEGIPMFKSVLALKTGEMSPPIASGAGALVYKLVARKSVVPKDFEAGKRGYADAYATQAANRAVGAEVEKMRDSGVVVWKSEGYHVLFDYVSMLATGDSSAQGEAFAKLEERASAAPTTDPAGSKPAALVRYLALQRVPTGKTPEAISAIKQKKIEAISNLLVTSENFDLRMELVDILVADKDPLAATELLHAVGNNNSPTEVGQRNFSDSIARLDKIKAAKIGSAEDLMAIDAELERWRKEKKEYDVGQAEIKLLADEDKKRAEAEAKAEADKNKPVKPVERGAAPKPKGK